MMASLFLFIAGAFALEPMDLGNDSRRVCLGSGKTLVL